jgi:hypothetical protein
MPIRLTCSACSKPMQAPDTAAGKRVKCPNCQAVVSVPSASAAPAAPPPAPPRAAPPPVPPSAPKAALPAPAAPAPAQTDNPFGFDDAPAKKSKKPARDERPEEDERPAKKKGRDRDRDERDEDDEEWEGPAPRKGAKGWTAFGSGCGTVKLGLWLEFAAITYVCILMLLAVAGVGRGSFGGGAIFLPAPLLLLAGTSFILLGRIKMLSAPKSSGAGTVLLGAVLLTVLRALAVLTGALMSVMAVVSDSRSAGDYAGYASVSLFIGAAPGAVAELTIVVAMAMAGGCIPNENLRRKAGLLTFVTQMFALAYFLLVALVLLAGRNLFAPPGGPPRSAIDPQTMIALVAVIYLLLSLVYTALQSSMYSAAQFATGGYNARKPKFDDDEE